MASSHEPEHRVSVTDSGEENIPLDKIETAKEDDSPTTPYKFRFISVLSVSGLIAGVMADQFHLAFLRSSQDQINEILGPVTNYQWMGWMAFYVSTIIATHSGYLSDIYGRRTLILLGSVLGLVGNVAAANVNTVTKVYGISAIMGAGTALHQLALPAVAEIVPRRWRPIAFGCFFAAMAPAYGFGSVIAQSIMKYHSWRLVFWIPFAINLLALFLTGVFYHPHLLHHHREGLGEDSKVDPWSIRHKLDYGSAFIVAAGAALGMLGILLGLFQYPWGSSQTIAILVCSGAICLFHVFYVWYVRDRLAIPMFPWSVYSNVRQYSLFIPCFLFVGAQYATTLIVWPKQVQLFYTEDLLKGTWYISAPSIVGIFTAPFWGLIYSRFSNISRYLLSLQIALLTLFTGLQAVSPTNAGVSTWINCMMGFLYVGFLSSLLSYVSLVPALYTATSVQFALTLTNIGTTIGDMTYSLILSNQLKDYLEENVARPLIGKGVQPLLLDNLIEAMRSGQLPASMDLSSYLTPEQIILFKEGTRTAFLRSLNICFYATIAWGGASLISLLLSKNVKDLMTNEVDSELVDSFSLNPKGHKNRVAKVVSHGMARQSSRV